MDSFCSHNAFHHLLLPVTTKPFWCYDAALNQWTKAEDYYYGEGIHGIKAVSLDSFAYIELGFIGEGFNAIDFWRYKSEE